jgi:hypothetical protein
MATKKTNQTESKFYVANTMAQAKEKIEEKVNTVKEKYVKKQVENTWQFINEIKADPVKKFDDIIDDGKDAISKLKTDRVETISKKVERVKKVAKQRVERLNKETQKVYEGIEHDARLIVEEMIALGKEKLDKLSMKKIIKEKVTKGMDAIPSKLNLPSKEEIDKLVTGIDGVNKKVDALNREFAGA